MSEIVLILVVEKLVKVVNRIAYSRWIDDFPCNLEDLLALRVSSESWIINFVQIEFI